MSEEIDPRIPALISKLLVQTRLGRVEWTRGRREDEYIYSSTGASVILDSEESDRAFPFNIRVTNADGDVVVAWLIFDDGESLSQETEELYQAAQNQALRVDETLDGLLKELDKPPS